MTEIGEIKQAKEIGRKGTRKYIWTTCEICDKERWVLLMRGKPGYRICIDCNKHKSYIHSEETKIKLSKAQIALGLNGEKSKWWKGGRNKSSKGYIRIKLLPNDFFYSMAGKDGYVLEHRLVMAKLLGRCLQPWEIVHHKDRIRDHNSADNLQLIQELQHKQITILENKIDKLLGMQEELYKEIRLLRFENKQLRENSYERT